MTDTATTTPAPADGTAEAVPAIEKRLELTAARDRVWRAITEPEELAKWFPESATLDLRADGDGHFEWREHGRFAVRVVAYEPPRYFAWRWTNDRDLGFEEAREKTLVEFWLDDAPSGGTILRLRETGFTRPSHRDGNFEGWDEELAELVRLLDAAG